ncbi:hypothetical protein BD413DRAFT_495835 [Trametes elegans]|nr:hypothetical protein BD413DRAFT_495835 [Trametes elegans]
MLRFSARLCALALLLSAAVAKAQSAPPPARTQGLYPCVETCLAETLQAYGCNGLYFFRYLGGCVQTSCASLGDEGAEEVGAIYRAECGTPSAAASATVAAEKRERTVAPDWLG